MAGNSEIWIKIFCEADEAAKKLESIAGGVESMGKRVSSVGQSISGVFDPMMKAITGGISLVSGAMAAVGVSAIGVGASFETQMTIVQNKSGATAEAMEQLKKKAEAMGQTLPLSASEVAEGFTLLAGRGLSAKEMMDAIEPSVALSITQNYDLVEATDAVGSAITQFSLGWDKAGEVVDIFTNTVNSSASGMEDLQLALSYVGKDAASVGLSLADTAAMIGELANAGIKGSRAGTSLRMMLSKLQAPTSEATAILKKYGVELESSPGKIKPVVQILQELNGKHLTGAEQIALFGTEAKTSASTLMATAMSLSRYSEELEKLGDTQKQLNKMLKSTENLLKALGSAKDAVDKTVFDGIQESLNGAIEEVTGFTLAFNEWLSSTDRLAEGGNKVKIMLDAFVEGLQLPVTSVKEFKEALNSIEIEAVADKFKSFGEGINSLVSQLSSLASKVPWGFLLDNLEMIVSVIVTGWASGKILTAIGNITTISGKLMGLGSKIPTAIGKFSTAVENAGGVMALFSTKLTTLITTLNGPAGVVIAIGAAVAAFFKLKKSMNEAKEANDAFNSVSVQTDESFREMTSSAITDKIEILTKRLKTLKEAQGSGIAGGAGSMIYTQQIEQEIERLKTALEDVTKKSNETTKKIVEKTDTSIQAILLSGLTRITQATTDKELQFRNAINLYGEDLKKLITESGGTGEEVTEKIMAGFGSLPENVATLMRQVVEKVRLSMVEINQVAEPKVSWGDGVSQGIDKAISDLQELGVTAKKQSELLGSSFGLGVDEVDKAFNEKMVGAATDSIAALEKKFDNPLIGKAFIARLKEVGKTSGAALLKEVADALEQVDNKIDSSDDWTGMKRITTDLGREQKSTEILDAIDTGQMTEVSRYFDEITTKWIDGNNEITQTFNSSTGLISRTSQSVLVDLKKQAEEARVEVQKNKQAEKTGTRATQVKPVSETTNITSKVQQVSAALVTSIDTAMSTLSQRMISAFTLGLAQMVIDANSYGTSIGNSLNTTIMAGVNKTVTEAKAKLKTIGSVSSDGTGTSLARAITEQGSDL